MHHPLVDGTPRFARIDAANHEINICVLGDLLYLGLHALPVQTPEEVDPMRQNNRLWESNLGSAEWRADAVGFSDRVRVDQGHCQSSGMTEGEERLMEVRKSGHDSTAVSATADDKYADWPLQQLRTGSMRHRCAASSFLRYSFSGSVSISADLGNTFLPARLLQRAAVPPFRFVRRPAPPG